MRIIGIVLFILSVPGFFWLLESRVRRRYAAVALGALPIFSTGLNLDVALIDWASWPGPTKGLLVTLVDSLAFAICLKLAPKRSFPPLLWCFIVYMASMAPGLFVGSLFQPALFTVWQALRVTLLFYAVYLMLQEGYLEQVAAGFAYSLFVNGAYVLRDIGAGAARAPGLLGHPNITGMAVNMCVPLLIALGLRTRRWLFLAAAAAAGFSAIAGGSRATIVFYVAAAFAILAGTAMLKSSARVRLLALLITGGLILALPLAIIKLDERGGSFEIDGERLAFERAAEMMIKDHPWGVGLNQYVPVANAGGYMNRAGVRWGYGARATNVHNTYLLTRVEGGLVFLLGFCAFLFIPIVLSVRSTIDKKNPYREISLAIAITLLVVAVHARYEWVTVTNVPQYLLAMLVGILASIRQSERATRGRKRASGHNVSPSNALDRPVSPKITELSELGADGQKL